MKQKIYLGDAVYARVDEFGVLILTTEDGISATNTIYLEPEIYDHLEMYMASVKEESSA